MKNWLIGALAVALVATAVPTESEAKRLGAGRSSGMQRNMPARTAPDAPPAKPANPAPQQAAPATAGAAAAAPAAAAAKRSWMGPIAGLAAGLGLAALMSHLGLGEAFGNFLMLALLVVAGLALVGFVMRRMGASRAAATAAGGAGSNSAARTQVAWPQAPSRAEPGFGGSSPPTVEPAATPEAPIAAATSATTASEPASVPEAAAGVARVFVPAAFDSEGFARTAKMIFIRLQTANDTADLDDLRRFTTPELFAAIRLDIQERGAQPQQTDVQKVDAEVLDVANEEQQQVVSVRFTGQMVEERGTAPTAFNEIWHLVKPHDDSRPWAIAGIEQTH